MSSDPHVPFPSHAGSDGLYREVTDFAADAPGWAHALAEHGTGGGPLVLAAVLAVACWRVRRAGPRVLARALLGPVAVAVAYGLSETVKLVVRQERPCRAVADAAPAIAPCPAPGDWSFPSNHATVAAAAAVAVVLVWRTAGRLVLPLAALTAFSRVFLGVHYPHDVVAGALLGAAVVPLVAWAAVRPAAVLVERVRVRLGRTEPVP
ncbi:phosphatase PAP2 family protein [Streptomyces carminius]|uniref:Phosphatase PAP2 family protein n=1 Tax=Streptomyces carminius TaxID=2665496 RepID=A0A2M8LWE7_9ACTN|nr:phosphatase PAP2 family protein [Streptomyces carminius]PJE96282.1 phosphatase PAP2 family protein [Streptomyces carminius]